MGKSDLALRLAGESFQIVSADSVQVYRYMDIGSGKPSQSDRARIQHYLIDIVDPDHSFTAGEYCSCADGVVKEITGLGKLPFFTGGTGLYIDSFFKGLSDIPDVDISVRKVLCDEMESRGLSVLYSELIEKDPVFGAHIHQNDRQRILRGLEIFRGTGRPISSYYNTATPRESEKTLYIGLTIERDQLKKRINARVDMMIRQGLIDEVHELRRLGYSPSLKSMKSIGYAEINDYLDGVTSLDGAVDLIKINTGKYSKRQMTWFRKNKKIVWFGPDQVDSIRDVIDIWMNRLMRSSS